MNSDVNTLNEKGDNTLTSVDMCNCPMCVNSSGFTLYISKVSQKCEDCNGTGQITSAKLNKLKKLYGDLIK